ncbi:MAG: (2Fe-2S)-binding protein [Planctomycetaceae bacterium]|nr:(2Fe-2S)-binding protein [Planctomycetaceae bacterium]
MPTVTFIKQKKQVEVPEGSNLRQEALKNGIEMHAGIHQYANCFGNGLCASCRVNVKKGMENVRRKTWWEYILFALNPIWPFARIGHEEEMTLACQSKVMGDCEVETTPDMNWHGEKFWG